MSNQKAVVKAVCISEKKGQQKHPVDAIRLEPHLGIPGDAHAGDWHRMVSVLSAESVRRLQEKIAFPLLPGAFAENVLVEGIEVSRLPVGTRLRSGRVLLEITQIGKQCHSGCAIFRAMGDCIMPREGVFARVLQGGTIHTGDEIVIVASKEEQP